MKKEGLTPTQLFVGSMQKIEEMAQNYVQSFFCKNKYEPNSDNIKNCFCSECKKIKKDQHPFFIHICPTKDYVLDDIKIIFEKTKFKLDDDQQFFFVLAQTEKLTAATANKLLKILEEPPNGYNFILLTNNENNILPTIKSRCLIRQFGTVDKIDAINHPIISFFLDKQKLNDPFGFEQELKRHNLTNSQALDLIHQLLSFTIKAIQKNSLLTKDSTSRDKYSEYMSNHKNIHTIIKRPITLNNSTIELKRLESLLKNKLKKPPQTGSANLFLRNIFISLSSQSTQNDNNNLLK